MKLNINKRAFSLTELMIVLVIIAVLFAAMAPIMTKRHSGATPSDLSVWRFVNDDAGRDAYFDGQMPKEASTAYIGIDTTRLPSGDRTPYSKVILRANANQSFIHFRYGSDRGIQAGIFGMNNQGSLVSGTPPVFISSGGANNTFAGAGVVQFGASSNSGNVGIGSYALQGNVDCRSSNNCAKANMNVAVGNNSGQNYKQSLTSNVFLGSNSGMGTNISDTVVAGTSALGMLDSKGEGNVYAGTYVASSGFNTDKSNGNTILGSMYSGNKGDNTIIGYNTYLAHYNNSSPTIDYLNASKMTAVGYHACSGVGAGSIDTCIGYESAQHTGSGTQELFINDGGEHIYIGGTPNGFGGRSVLEVHNFVPPSHSKSVKPDIGPTVIMNSHLVVRGNVIFPTKDGVLRPHALAGTYSYKRSGKENARDDCCRYGGVFGRRHWMDPSNCGWSFWGKVGLAILDYATLGNSILGANILGAITGLSNSWFGPWTALFGEKNKERPKDPISFSGAIFEDAPSCYGDDDNSHINYPTSNSNCPDLQLSDARLKENITENADSIEKLLLIMPYNYTFKADKDRTPQVGVIAQDLQKYSPNSVSEGDDGYLQIRWDEMFYVTINSIKSLNTKLSEISKSVDKMQADVYVVTKEQNNVQRRVTALNKRVSKLEK